MHAKPFDRPCGQWRPPGHFIRGYERGRNEFRWESSRKRVPPHKLIHGKHSTQTGWGFSSNDEIRRLHVMDGERV